MTAQQLGLFSDSAAPTNGPQFEPGEIVIAAEYNGGIVPFWQLRFSEWQPGQGQAGRWGYYATPVPHGIFPGEVSWLYAEWGVHRTGLSWRIVPWGELSEWSRSASRLEFPEHLNFPCNGFYAPYAQEAELVELLRPLGRWDGWTPETFEERLRVALAAVKP